MFTLILLLVSGGLLAYVAQDNLSPISVIVGPYVLSDIPLFYVIIGSFLAGLVLCYLFHLVHVVSSSWTLRAKQNEVREGKDEVLELTKRVHQLELENQKLKLGHIDEPEDSNAL